MSRRWIALAGAVCCVLSSTAAHAAPATLPGGQRLDMSAGLTTSYDSNLLQYSDAQLGQFDGGLHADRFSIETRDDMTWTPELGLAWELDAGHGRRHLVRARGQGDFHTKDGTADFRAASVTWRESFRRERRLALGYYAIPHYYLRQLSDEDLVLPFPGLSRYRRAEFALDIASVSWSQRAGRAMQAALGYQFERRRYNARFRERDSGTHQGEFTVDLNRLPRHANVEARLQYRSSDAKADDGDAVVSPEDDVDVGYHGPGGAVSGRMEFARRGAVRVGADLAFETEIRDFGSGRPRDTYHFGRTDHRFAVESGLRVQLRRIGSARAFWRYEKNDARLGTTAPVSADAGSYRQHVAGLALDISATLWRSKGNRESGREE